MYEVRVAGPDDVHTHDDELTALRQANKINQAFLADMLKHPGPGPADMVLCVATVHHVPQHGVDCNKAPHNGGNLHDESDDTPFDVDGVRYCGRCHMAL